MDRHDIQTVSTGGPYNRADIRASLIGGQALSPSFSSAFQTSLSPSVALGSYTPTFTRATTGYVLGYAASAVLGVDDPVLLLCASGEARFKGARRISEGVWSSYDANGVFLSTTNGASALCCDASGPLGYLAEGARTNYFLQSLAPATQTIATLATGTYTTSVGAGGTLTISAGTATITGGGTATSTTPLTFVVTVSGTVVATVASAPAWGQVELGAFASSLIPTTTVAVTRNADVLTYPSAGNISGTVGTLYAEVTVGPPSTTAARVIAQGDHSHAAFAYFVTTSGYLSLYDGTARSLVSASLPLTSVTKAATSWGGSVSSGALSGVSGTSGFDGDMNLTGALGIACTNDGLGQIFGTIRNVQIFPVALSAAQLQAMTSP